MSIYFGLAIALIVGGWLLEMIGKDAVTQAESRKQGILEAEQMTMVYPKATGSIKEIRAAVGQAIKKGDILFKIQSDETTVGSIFAPQDGLISEIMVKPGDLMKQGAPMVILQKNNYFTDLYIQESEIRKLKVNQNIGVDFPYIDHPKQVRGVVTTISAALPFATMRMTREKGQADVSMFLVRVAVDASADVLPGMTAEVKLNEITN
ncbi:HlyD family efflux transporter periplasmic adaptor subunit [Paenibacillus shirakamiensis]|nr:HlyD family efflux transporter periplasmic adaptor subunit [Paenibacillus shirakamiensis]